MPNPWEPKIVPSIPDEEIYEEDEESEEDWEDEQCFECGEIGEHCVCEEI